MEWSGWIPKTVLTTRAPMVRIKKPTMQCLNLVILFTSRTSKPMRGRVRNKNTQTAWWWRWWGCLLGWWWGGGVGRLFEKLTTMLTLACCLSILLVILLFTILTLLTMLMMKWTKIRKGGTLTTTTSARVQTTLLPPSPRCDSWGWGEDRLEPTQLLLGGAKADYKKTN